MSKDQYDYNLSASKLNLFRDDPCAFWLVEHKILKMPDMPFPTITRGVDIIMKNYMDQFRGGLPPHLEGHVRGNLYAGSDEMNRWRHWQSGLKAFVTTVGGKRVRMIGALDDLATANSDRGIALFSPIDNKSKGFEPKDDGATWYQIQCDVYALLLRENNMTPSGRAYLVYTWPTEAYGPAEPVAMGKPSRFSSWFDSKVFTLEAKPERAIEVIEQAVACLEGPRPEPTTGKTSGFAEAYAQAYAEPLPAIMDEMLAALKECLDLGLSNMDPTLHVVGQVKRAIAHADSIMDDTKKDPA